MANFIIKLLLSVCPPFRRRFILERAAIFCVACAYLKRDEPDVYDTDRILSFVDEFLSLLHDDPSCVSGLIPNARRMLGLTRFLSRFTRLASSRDEVKRCMTFYTATLGDMEGDYRNAVGVGAFVGLLINSGVKA